MIEFLDDCKHIAFLYANDRTHWDKPACMCGHGSYPHDWSCRGCNDYEARR